MILQYLHNKQTQNKHYKTHHHHRTTYHKPHKDAEPTTNHLTKRGQKKCGKVCNRQGQPKKIDVHEIREVQSECCQLTLSGYALPTLSRPPYFFLIYFSGVGIFNIFAYAFFTINSAFGKSFRRNHKLCVYLKSPSLLL